MYQVMPDDATAVSSNLCVSHGTGRDHHLPDANLKHVVEIDEAAD